MPRKDAFHDAVKNALIKDGWTITHDPYTMEFEKEPLYIDLGAEMPLAAEKGMQKMPSRSKVLSGDPV